MQRKRWRRRTISIAASLLAHLILLSSLLWLAPGLRTTPVASRPDVQLDLVRNVDVRDGRLHPSKSAEKAERPRSRAPAPSLPQLASEPSSRQPTPQASPLAATVPAGGMTEAGAGAPPGDARARAALRAALGCLNPDLAKLTEAERAACRDRLRQASAAMGDATVDPISDIRKRAYYDQVKAARDAMNSYNPVNGPMPGNGPGIGCKHGKCGFIPPSGALTEEWGIKPP
jgi:hypothetical protein